MDIRVVHDEAVGVVVLTGDLDTAEAPRLRATLADLIDRGHVRLVLDLAGVPYMDSAGLGALIAGMKRARMAGGDIRLCAVQEDVRAILEMTRLTKVIDLFPTRAAAAAWEARPPG